MTVAGPAAVETLAAVGYTSPVPIIGGRDLRKSYGDREILAGIALTIEAGERLGLIGSNGSGKTTLAHVLAGVVEPDTGEVTRARGSSLGYLAQEPEMDPGASAVAIALSGLTEWSRAVARHEEISAEITAGGVTDGLLAAQADAAAAVERLGGWELRHQAEAMLGHLGVSDLARPVGTMSGGERRRVALARLLVARPDIAILDEPTNHLDIATIEWLERFLVDRYSGGLLLITHDRYLLDRVVHRTLEIDRGLLYSYEGGWSEYLAARAERMAHDERVENNRQNFLRRELDWLRRQPRARTGKQKARIARAHQALDVAAPTRAGSARIAVGAVRSGKSVLDCRDLEVTIPAGADRSPRPDLAPGPESGSDRLVDGLTLSLGKGERVGIVGANGAGKTTLLRVLIGELAPAGGSVVLGQNTRVAYLDQARAGLDDHATVFDNVATGRSLLTLGQQKLEVRSYLERFLFTSGAQTQLVGTLSGGERGRVALARVLSEPSNLVALDEPTNDLDVATLAALEAALLDFAGTVLVVTHDRWFLDRVATSILGFEGAGRVVHVHGGYTDYLRWQASDRAAAAPPVVAPAPSRRQAPPAAPTAAVPGENRPLTYGERLELAGLMDRIAAAEAEVAELEAGLSDAGFADRDYPAQVAYLEQLGAARARVDELVERWSELESRNP